MSDLRFTKMHGAGNDFIVIEAIHQSVPTNASVLARLADRRWGIGADQILLVEGSDRSGIDFCYRIFNADGGEVEQCGNGARCFMRFVVEKGLTTKRKVCVETLSGDICLEYQIDGRIRVNMGVPVWDIAAVPFNAAGLTSRMEGDARLWQLDLRPFAGGETKEISLKEKARMSPWVSVVSLGNPHAVQIVEDLEQAPVVEQGPLIETQPCFPNRVNAGYLLPVSAHSARLRVWERGAGETLSCGSGACAAAICGIRQGKLLSPVEIQTKGGGLTIEWGSPYSAVFLTGQAVTVFEGRVALSNLT